MWFYRLGRTSAFQVSFGVALPSFGAVPPYLSKISLVRLRAWCACRACLIELVRLLRLFNIGALARLFAA